jgi:hypothetical protein
MEGLGGSSWMISIKNLIGWLKSDGIKTAE